MVAVAHEDKIHVLGGNIVPFGIAVTTHDVFDVEKEEWSVGPPMPTPRANAAAAVLQDSIFVTGGMSSFFGGFLGITDKFDIEGGTWTPATAKPTPTAETVGIHHDEQIFVIGGGFFGAGAGSLGSVNESFSVPL
jgi:hypothetical protein